METKDIPEGDDHELEAKGVEMVKSSTPEIVRDFMRDYILSFLKNVDLKKSNDQINEIFKKFKTVPLEKIAKITNVNGIAKYTGPDGMPMQRTPFHVKGTIGYNNLLKTKGLEDYEPIYEGDKVKVVYIRENPWYAFNAVAFKDKLPDELGLKELVDYDIMWNKVFIDPIKQFYDVVGWQMPNLEQEDITDLFS
jgi:DNA polymerase elongation subunit (family B)